MLAWTCLIAPGCGALVGAAGVRLWPLGLGVPGFWAILLIWSDLSAPGDLPTPLWAACFVAGLHALGLGLGLLLPGRPWALAGLLVLALSFASGLPVQGGLGRESWASEHPRLARVLLEASPLVVATECAGLDWTHSQPSMYALSGVEWFPRRPHRGPLAGPAWLLVGCVFAVVASRRARRVAGPGVARE